MSRDNCNATLREETLAILLFFLPKSRNLGQRLENAQNIHSRIFTYSGILLLIKK